MKVLVLANDALKEELLAQPAAELIRWQWLETPGDPVAHAGTDACIDLLFEHTPERVEWLKQLEASIVIINSVIVPLEVINEHFVRINGWKTFLQRPLAEVACRNETTRENAEKLFHLLGRKTEWVPDIPGFITPRVVAAIINEAFLTLEEGVSGEAEIDTAMKLGTNYPYGPFEWGKKIGLEQVYALLEALSQKQERYQPSALLKGKILV